MSGAHLSPRTVEARGAVAAARAVGQALLVAEGARRTRLLVDAVRTVVAQRTRDGEDRPGGTISASLHTPNTSILNNIY